MHGYPCAVHACVVDAAAAAAAAAQRRCGDTLEAQSLLLRCNGRIAASSWRRYTVSDEHGALNCTL